MSAIDAILKDFTTPNRASGPSIHGASFVAVTRDGKVHSHTAGSLDADGKGPPMRIDALSWLASQSKLVTSIAAMLAIEQGLIGLDDDVGDYVPELKEMDVLEGFEGEQGSKKMDPAAMVFVFEKPRKPIMRKKTKAITLRLLLTHSSGFSYDFMNEGLMEWSQYIGKKPEMDTSMETYYFPLTYEPGTSWAYGCGIDWAGRTVEKVSGMNLDDFMKKHIFDPLGMKNTTFYPDNRSDLPPMQGLGVRMQGPEGPLTAGPQPMKRPPIDCCGGIGLYSTAEDYGKLLADLVSSKPKVIKPETLKEMLRPQASKPDDFNNLAQGMFRQYMSADWMPETKGDYSLCGAVNATDIPGRRAAGSAHWSGMSNPNWWLDPVNGVAGCIFTQVLPPGDPALMEAYIKCEEEVYKML